jgi:SAM-dependent methyltransferase
VPDNKTVNTVREQAGSSKDFSAQMDFVAAAKAIEKDTGWTGGPSQLFEKVGRDARDTALALGLVPRHKLLDFGAGMLRLGYWFVRFLDAGNYYAIEPRAAALEAGKKHLIGSDILRDKSPHFYVSKKCDMTTFGVAFDFVVARSILTHAKPGMLHRMLEEYSKCAAPQGIMLASYWALEGKNACTLDGHIGDRLGHNDWGFVGVIKYSLGYLKAAALEHGLTVEEFAVSPPLNQQIWLTFRKLSASPSQ